MFYRLNYTFRRWRYQKKSAGTPLQPLYEQPPFSLARSFSQTRFLVVDCEMSGLNVKRAELLSIGWVMIENGRISNSTARHLLVHSDKGAGESIKIHGLLDSNLAGAHSAAAVLMLLIRQMPGTVLVFHHAFLDIRFLQRAAWANFRCPMLFSYVDTMEIEKRRIESQGKPRGLRLNQCRQHYGLPPVTQHNALADAHATAELLLAQASYLTMNRELSLSRLSPHC